ncbi:BRO family protein [Ulvibacter sp. MAR_2010_11]|uniref:BRO-N domain-containing protein n=1 Tax=Ulvibacter sp. MAR_2010_11 TaxID=1250229 RepID=UPI0018E28062|nr:BRO family protein [Ulvibacter sp. MAR_2010_11]
MKTRTVSKKPLNYFQQLMSVEIDNQIWFVADDVTKILELNDPVEVLDSLDENERICSEIFRDGKKKTVNLVSESGLYALIFRSDTTSAKRFREWVTNQVLPLIRIRGYYTTKRLEIPNFVIRFNDNYDRIATGYFSVLTELFIRLYGRFEKLGYLIPNKALTGKQMHPEVSVGLHFDDYLEKNFPKSKDDYTLYQHRLPNGKEI